MAQLFNMPMLGSTMEEGTVLRWFKREGETVRKGEPLLEVETDKASMEVEAGADCVVRRIVANEGAVVAVQAPLAILGTADEPIDTLLMQAGLGSEAVPSPGEAVNAELKQYARDAADDAPTPAQNAAAAASAASHVRADAVPLSGQVFVSPRAARLAEELGISVNALAGRGTGPEGRVIERDIRAYAEEQRRRPTVEVPAATPERTARVTPLAARIADDLGVDIGDLAFGLPGSRVRREDVVRHAETKQPEPAPVASQNQPPAASSQQGVTVTKLAGMRKRIADNIVKSRFTAPHVTLTLEADMTACAAFRAQVLPDVEKAYGVRLSYTDILVKAVARALGEFPAINSALLGDEIHIYTAKNIGVAVALDEGLVVPVIKEADKKSLGAVSQELKQLVDRCRTGKFTPDDLAGGTFSITNLGAFGIDVFDPVIVPPQAAILGVGRIADKPVVANKEVVVRSMMNLCLSFDHRVLDGAPAARFLQRLKELLESPMAILL